MISVGCEQSRSLRSISRQTRFSEVEITLDAPQRLVIDDVFISQPNDRSAFNLQGVILQSLVLRRGDLTAAIFWISSTKLQLLYSLVVFRAQAVDDIGREAVVFSHCSDEGERGLISFKSRLSLLFVSYIVTFYS